MRPWAYRVNAVSFAVLTLAAIALSVGYWPGDPGWMVAGLGAAALFAVNAGLLWRRVPWAGPVGFGLTAFSLGLWTQSLIALAFVAGRSPGAPISGTTCAIGLGRSVIAMGLVLAIPRAVPLRHWLSIAFAGAALVPAVVFALAPAQSTVVALAVGVGSAAVLAGTVAVGRGRTWGLLLNLLGAAILGGGVAFAPSLGWITTAHPWLPNAGVFLVDILGMTAAGLAGVSTAIYLGPLVRFALRRD